MKGFTVNIFRDSNDKKSLNILPDGENRAAIVNKENLNIFDVDEMDDDLKLEIHTKHVGGDEYVYAKPAGLDKHTMFGGSFIYSSDSRFQEEVNKYPVPVHDRVEDQEFWKKKNVEKEKYFAVIDRDGKIHAVWSTVSQAELELQRLQSHSYDYATKYEGWKIEELELIPVEKIVVTRAEGPSDQCGKPIEAMSFREADNILGNWAGSVPKDGGYDKCDFTITFADGDIYSGTYELKHPSNELPNLMRHVKDHLEFYGSIKQPRHFTDEQWESHMNWIGHDVVEDIRNNYYTYNFHVRGI